MEERKIKTLHFLFFPQISIYLTIVNKCFYQFIPKSIPTLLDWRIPYNNIPKKTKYIYTRNNRIVDGGVKQGEGTSTLSLNQLFIKTLQSSQMGRGGCG